MIFAITNQKGGVGKTTTVLNIGIYLASQGKKVLLVDDDPQASLTTFLKNFLKFSKTLYDIIIGEGKAQPAIYPTKYNNLYFIPSSLALFTADIQLAGANGARETRLKKALDEIKGNFDYILIDCPPALSMLTLNAYMASDKFFIVIEPDVTSIEGLPQLSTTIEKIIKGSLGHNIQLGGIILNMAKDSKDLKGNIRDLPTRFIVNKVQKTLPGLLFPVHLPYRNIVKNAKAINKSPLELLRNDYSQAIANLSKLMFNL